MPRIYPKLGVLADALTENTNEGTDSVETGITYSLGADIESLLLTGNTLNNVIIGNSAANTLNFASSG